MSDSSTTGTHRPTSDRRKATPRLVLGLLMAILIICALPALAAQPPGSPAPSTATTRSDGAMTSYIPLVTSHYRDFSPEQSRFGVNKVRNAIDNYQVYGLNAAWYVTPAELNPPIPAGMQPVFLIHLKGIDPDRITLALAPIVARNPNRLWLVGNEPDREAHQDDLTPSEYVVYYHNIYHFLKTEDPTAQIAIGGVVQPTPLRLYYLDMILTAYQDHYGQPMPVDVWNIHNMILNEHPTEWGAGIPPGVPDDVAEALRVSRSVSDNDNMTIFQQQIWDFRQWMADRGQRNKPLIITEVGVLMPVEWYPQFDRQRLRTFMIAAFDFMLSAQNDSLGYPGDDNRLVQQWAWYSLDDKFDPNTGQGFNGNLFHPDTFEITGHGIDFGAYTAGLR